MIIYEHGKPRKMTDKEEMDEYRRIKAAVEEDRRQYEYSKGQIELIPAMTSDYPNADVDLVNRRTYLQSGWALCSLQRRTTMKLKYSTARKTIRRVDLSLSRRLRQLRRLLTLEEKNK